MQTLLNGGKAVLGFLAGGASLFGGTLSALTGGVSLLGGALSVLTGGLDPAGAAVNAIDGAILGGPCGGQSFTAATKVLLASGAAIPIAGLKRGDKVLAMSVKTGKTQGEPVTAVLVNHDTDLYNLKIKAGNRTAVIHTTASHLFWDLIWHMGCREQTIEK